MLAGLPLVPAAVVGRSFSAVGSADGCGCGDLHGLEGLEDVLVALSLCQSRSLLIVTLILTRITTIIARSSTIIIMREPCLARMILSELFPVSLDSSVYTLSLRLELRSPYCGKLDSGARPRHALKFLQSAAPATEAHVVPHQYEWTNFKTLCVYAHATRIGLRYLLEPIPAGSTESSNGETQTLNQHL